ncbi:hypothetical protein ACOME3_009593 [Neoechinorhynchus agilis]
MVPQLSDLQRIGVGLLLFGLSFLTLGTLLFFDRGLLAIGNLLLVVGVVLIIGLERALRFFFRKSNRTSTFALSGGMIVVLAGWTIFGMILELYGLAALFGGFIPVLINYLRNLPGIGHVLMLPGIKQVVDSISMPKTMV